MASKKTLEINPYHPIITELAKKSKESTDDEATKELAWVLYDSSLITAGFDIDDQVRNADVCFIQCRLLTKVVQATFSTRMLKLLRRGLDINDDAKVVINS